MNFNFNSRIQEDLSLFQFKFRSFFAKTNAKKADDESLAGQQEKSGKEKRRSDGEADNNNAVR